MIVCEPTRRGDKVRVTFVLPNDGDADVFVAGDFNGWNPGATPLKRRGAVRKASLILASGRRYAFRYYRGGCWFNDQQAHTYDLNEYGEQNSVLDLTMTS